MHWITTSSKDTATATLEQRLWEAADQLRANSGLTSQQCSRPVLGLIFLGFAQVRFAARRAALSLVKSLAREVGIADGALTAAAAKNTLTRANS